MEAAGNTNATPDQGNAPKDYKKAIRQVRTVALIVCAILAIRYFSHQYYMNQVDQASANLTAENVETRLAAVEKLRDIDEPEGYAELLKALKDKSSTVRAGAAAALYGWEDERALEALLEALSDNSGDVRAQAASSLFGRVDDRALNALLASLKDRDDEVRRQAAISLLPFVRTYQEIPEATAQQREAAVGALEKAFEAKNYPVIAGGAAYFIEKGEDGTENRLISALKRCGSKGLAETYLNCGNEKLVAAAEDWAERHDYWIQTTQAGYTTVIWGSSSR